MEPLIISIESLSDHPNTYIISFEGEFDGHAKESLTEIQAFVDEVKPHAAVILDFSKLNYMNSYAIGQLINWRKHLINIKGQLFIAGANTGVEESLSIVGSSILFRMFEDTDTAIEAI